MVVDFTLGVGISCASGVGDLLPLLQWPASIAWLQRIPVIFTIQGFSVLYPDATKV